MDLLTRRRFLGMVGAGVAGGALYTFGIEPHWLRTERVELALHRLPAAFDGYTIVQLSDLHVGSGISLGFLRDAVALANEELPDLVVVTGDLVDEYGRDGAAGEAGRLLRELDAPDGALAVLGNHDTGAFHPGYEVKTAELAHLVDRVEGAGVRVLENRAHLLVRGGARVRVAGLGDLWSGRFDAARALASGADAPVTIALSHNPDSAPELARRGVDLVLSGHTHGGQVNLPWFGPPYFPQEHKEFVAGLYEVGGARLYVNRGLGYTHRVRFNARPELTVITLRCGAERAV